VFDRLAYTIGFFLGDGCLTSYPFKSSSNGRTYYKNDVVFVSSDLESLEKAHEQIADVFGKSYAFVRRTLKSGTPHWNFCAHRRDIFDFFAVNTAMRKEIPKYYFSAEASVQKELIAGLMDTDGHCTRTTGGSGLPRWQIGFSNGNLGLVQDVASILQKHNVSVGAITEGRKAGYKSMWIIHPNIRQYIDRGFGFSVLRKQQRLNDYVSHVSGSETTMAAPLT